MIKLGGSSGQAIQVQTNFFQLNLPERPKIYHHYNVIISGTPELRNKGRSVIIDRLQTVFFAQLFVGRAVFDGKSSLFSPFEIKLEGGAASYTVNRFDNSSQSSGLGSYNVKLVKVGEVILSDIPSTQTIIAQNTNDSLAMVQLLNLLVRQAAILIHPHKGRSVYVEQGFRPVGPLEFWSGVFQSVRPTLSKFLVNVDTSTAVMYKRGPLIDVVMEFLGKRNTNLRDLENVHNKLDQWKRLKSFLKNIEVDIQSLKRPRRIDSLVENAGNYEFRKDNTTMKVKDYYRIFKNLSISFPLLPGIRTGPDAVIPIELCKITKPQFYRKKLSGADTSTMLNYTKKKPRQRLDAIRQTFDTLAYDRSDYMRNAELRVNPNPMRVSARLLEAPNVHYGAKEIETPQDGSWNLLNKQFRQPSAISSWAVVCFDNTFDVSMQQNFITNLRDCLKALGVLVKDWPPLYQGWGQNVEQALVAGMNEAGNKFRSTPEIMVVILPFPSAAIRKAVKVWGDTLVGMPTQIVSSDKIRASTIAGRIKSQYLNNLALKINAKLGGTNSVVVGPGMKWFREVPTMILGADVNHPGPGVNRPSIASLVNTVDDNAVKYFASVKVQQPRQEIIQDLDDLIATSVEQFVEFNKETRVVNGTKQVRRTYPQRIVFFRDGVSEGEFRTVSEIEIKTMKEKLTEIWKRYKLPETCIPKITFITVGKRHHARFFPIQGRGADNSGNVKAGMVVDSEITNPDPSVFDYYLQSHGGILGTSRPSHYTVLLNENDMTVDELQALSYELCYAYARCTRSVSIPAPVYYADICCARADFYFADYDFTDELEGSSTDSEFNLKFWENAFKGPKLAQARQMYFM